MEPLLEVKNLTRTFRGREKKEFAAVDHVSFCLYPGETLGIVGESGSGKSTLARTILALTRPTAGKVFYEGQDITGFHGGHQKKLRSELQMIFQDPYASLNPKMKIGPAIAEPMLAHGYAKNGREAKEKVEELLRTIGLQPEVYDRYPHEFSGGQRQRIGIARALATQPKLLFCDESVSALDVSVQAQILNLFNTLKQQRNLTYIFIGHDLAVVRYISDRILVMYLGKVMEIAPYDSLYSEESHPYTQALISAVPEPSTAPRKDRILLTGDVPSPVNPPKGCRFCQRCFKAKPECFEREPEMVRVGPDHYVRCHFAKEVKEA